MAGRRRERAARLIAACCVAVAGSGVLAGCSDADPPSGPALAARFLDRYVSSDGRVLRRDQGGDIVSEGEAYAMVLAEIAGRSTTVRTVWRWTSSHLRRPDGLLSWHADASGHVLDPQSAGDADVLAAWALVAYRGPGQTALQTAGRRLAAAVLAHETVAVGDRRLLAAGPWAVDATPPVVNPSYWMPSVFRSLADETGSQAWNQLADDAVAVLSRLTYDGMRLPPDWAVADGGRVVPSGPPGGGGGEPQFGPDAERLPVWLAVDCTSAGRSLAAEWWRLVDDDSAALARALDGSVENADQVPLAEVAAAAGADAAGHEDTSGAAMRAALDRARAHPTYYGDAWVALGSTLLQDRGPVC